MIALHPVPFVGAPLLVLGLYVATVAACAGLTPLALVAGLVAGLSAALLSLGGF